MMNLAWLLLLRAKPRLRIVLLSLLLFIFITAGVGWNMPAYPRATLQLPGDCGFFRFSPDSKSLLTTGEGQYRAKVGPIRIWGVEQGVERFAVASDWEQIDPLAFSPDGKVIAAHNRQGDLKLWDAATGMEIVSLKPRTASQYGGTFVFSPDGRCLAIHDDDHGPQKDRIRLWDIRTQRDRGYIDGDFWALTFSPDGQSAATFARKDDATGKIVTRIMLWRLEDERGPTLVAERQLQAEAVAFSPDLGTLAIVSEPRISGEIELWDMPAFAKRATIPYESAECTCHMDLDTCKLISHPLAGVPSLRFSADGRILVSGWRTKETLWTVSSKPNCLGEYDSDAVISSDGRWLATPHATGATIFSLEKMQEQGTLKNAGDIEHPLRNRSLWSRDYASVAFSPDCRLAAIGEVFQLNKPSPLAKWLPRQVNPFHEDPLPWSGPFVRIWNVESCRELCAFEDCKEAVFSPDGATLATLHCDKTIKLWNLPVRKPLGRILAVAAPIYLLSVSLFWLVVTVFRKLARGRPFSKHRVLAAQPSGALRDIGHEAAV